MISEECGEEKIVYQYDALNRLCSVEKLRKWMVKSAYDSYGRCVQTKKYRWNNGWIEEEKRFYLHQGLHEIGSLDADGNIKQLRILGKREGMAFRAAIAIELEGEVFAPLYNQRYDVMALLDGSTGAPVESYRYSAFGEFQLYNSQGEKVNQTNVSNCWLYGNKRYDPLTRLFNFGKRYYRPALGRWITPDSGDFVDGYNLYAYTHNHPLTCSDFFGFSTCNTVKQNSNQSSFFGKIGNVWNRTCGVVTDSVIKAYNCTVDACAAASRCAGKAIELGSHHLIPSSPIQYLGEGIGRLLQGESFTHDYSGDLFSASGQVGNKEFRNCMVRYISGYLCSKEMTENTAKTISEMLDNHYVYYTSHQSRGFMSDNLAVAMSQLNLDHYSIDYLNSTIIQDYANMKLSCGEDFRLYYYTHSRGALDFYYATTDLPNEIKQKMHVITLGGAVKLPDSEFGGAKNFENNYDFIRPISRLLTPNLSKCTIEQTNYSSGFFLSPIYDHFVDSEGYNKIIEKTINDIKYVEL